MENTGSPYPIYQNLVMERLLLRMEKLEARMDQIESRCISTSIECSNSSAHVGTNPNINLNNDWFASYHYYMAKKVSNTAVQCL